MSFFYLLLSLNTSQERKLNWWHWKRQSYLVQFNRCVQTRVIKLKLQSKRHAMCTNQRFKLSTNLESHYSTTAYRMVTQMSIYILTVDKLVVFLLFLHTSLGLENIQNTNQHQSDDNNNNNNNNNKSAWDREDEWNVELQASQSRTDVFFRN